MKSYSWLIIIAVLCSTTLEAQSVSDLQKERMNVLLKIERTENELQQNKRSEKAVLEDLTLINQQISSRQEVIGNISSSLEALEYEESRLTSKIDSLKEKFAKSREEYGVLIRAEYRQKHLKSKWLQLINFTEINRTFRKWRLSRQYKSFLDSKTQKLNGEYLRIQDALEKSEELKKVQLALLADEKGQIESMESERIQKQSIVQDLKSNHEQIQYQIRQQKREREKLNAEIEKIIYNSSEVSPNRSSIGGDVNVRSNQSFQSQRSSLPWPVKDHIVISTFGTKRHKELKDVEVTNSGIDIRSQTGASVRVIANGMVVGVSQIPGHQTMILIKHGDFFTVYSKIQDSYVSPGQQVTQGTEIGRLGHESDKKDLHFEVWKGKTKLNPLLWLSRK